MMPDEEPVPPQPYQSNKGALILSGIALVCTASGWVANVVWGAGATHAQFEQLSQIVTGHTKDISDVKNDMAQTRTDQAVLLEKTANIEKSVDRIEQELMRQGRKDQK